MRRRASVDLPLPGKPSKMTQRRSFFLETPASFSMAAAVHAAMLVSRNFLAGAKKMGCQPKNL